MSQGERPLPKHITVAFTEVKSANIARVLNICIWPINLGKDTADHSLHGAFIPAVTSVVRRARAHWKERHQTDVEDGSPTFTGTI